MNTSWATGITISIVIFITAVISLVIYAHTFDVNLVADNYYEQEIKHQEMIDKRERTQKLAEQVSTGIENNNIIVRFPGIFKYYEINGEIDLYRPSDRKEDIKLKIELSKDMIQEISTSQLAKGLWRIKIDWSARDSAYFNEKILMIN